MSADSPRLPRPMDQTVLIYPPAWYLNLVELRSRLSKECGRSLTMGMNSVWNADPENEGVEAARLLALALEIVRSPHLEELPRVYQAHVLGLDIAEVREYLGKVSGEIDLQEAVATLIIEDEAAVALDLARIVRRTGHRVCGTAGECKQAVDLADRTRPVLVLADVQLKEGPEAGIAAVQRIRRSGDAVAVYVTAYPERVRHSVSEPLIVSKPFMPHDIQTAIWRALVRRGYATSAAA